MKRVSDFNLDHNLVKELDEPVTDLDPNQGDHPFCLDEIILKIMKYVYQPGLLPHVVILDLIRSVTSTSKRFYQHFTKARILYLLVQTIPDLFELWENGYYNPMFVASVNDYLHSPSFHSCPVGGRKVQYIPLLDYRNFLNQYSSDHMPNDVAVQFLVDGLNIVAGGFASQIGLWYLESYLLSCKQQRLNVDTLHPIDILDSDHDHYFLSDKQELFENIMLTLGNYAKTGKYTVRWKYSTISKPYINNPSGKEDEYYWYDVTESTQSTLLPRPSSYPYEDLDQIPKIVAMATVDKVQVTNDVYGIFGSTMKMMDLMFMRVLNETNLDVKEHLKLVFKTFDISSACFGLQFVQKGVFTLSNRNPTSDCNLYTTPYNYYQMMTEQCGTSIHIMKARPLKHQPNLQDRLDKYEKRGWTTSTNMPRVLFVKITGELLSKMDANGFL